MVGHRNSLGIGLARRDQSMMEQVAQEALKDRATPPIRASQQRRTTSPDAGFGLKKPNKKLPESLMSNIAKYRTLFSA